MSDENTTYVNKISPVGPTESEKKLINKMANSNVQIQTVNAVSKEPMIPAVRTRHKNLGPWFITVAEGPILPCEHIEELEKQLELKSSPDMIFQDNLFSLSFLTPDPNLPNKNPICETKFFNKPSDFTIKFTAMGALKNIEKSEESYNYVKVGSTESWQATRDLSKIPIKDQGNWLFSTIYQGETFSRDDTFKFEELLKTDENDPKYKIDYARLKNRSNPIMMSEDIVLYEDELDDNGQSQVRIRFRIDDILIRLIETRLFYLNGAEHITKETCYREFKWNAVKEALCKNNVGPQTREQNPLYNPDLMTHLLMERPGLLEEISCKNDRKIEVCRLKAPK